MRREGKWGDMIAVDAAANVMGVRIQVWELSDGNLKLLLFTPQQIVRADAIQDLLIGNIDNKHFFLLRSTENNHRNPQKQGIFCMQIFFCFD